MSELINAKNAERDFRWCLLTTVSALSLLAAVSMRNANADDQDADRPTVWVELGGQLVHVSGQGDNFPVGFQTKYQDSTVLQGTAPLQAQKPAPFEFAEEGKLSFQPEGSDLVFSAAVNYGRSSNAKHVDNQTKGTFFVGYVSGIPTTHQNVHGTDKFADTHADHRESHAIVDFSVGRDVGLGMFGKGGSSVLSLGVRVAQFSSMATFDVRARPDLQFDDIHLSFGTLHLPYFHTYHNSGQASRSFHGVGPSLSWNGSAPFAGNQQSGEVTVDWGANAAILFGRQRASVSHEEIGRYKGPKYALTGHPYATLYQHSGSHNGVRSVTVPNVGGFAGASYRIENFKVSFGYRADFFFGAVDGGVDARKSETLGFYGPFASVSVGLGG